MKVSYRREMRHNYLILEALENNSESFEIRMLTGNSIEGLLKFRVKQEEQNRFYYYEITSRQPLSRLLEFREIRKEELSRLIIGIEKALNRIEDYLLEEDNVLLEPEYIYIQPESYEIWLCYVPGYHGNFPEAMEKLLQYLLKKADHRDNETVVLAYRLYQETQKDFFGMEDLLRAIRESRQSSGYSEQARESGIVQKEEIREQDSFLEEKTDIQESAFSPEKADIREKACFSESDGIREKFGWTKEAGSKRTAEGQTSVRFGVWKQIGLLVLFLAAGPLVLGGLYGPAAVRQYGTILAALDVGAAVGIMAFLIQRKRGRTGKKERERQEEKADWYMTFAEDPEEKNEVPERENERSRTVQKEPESIPSATSSAVNTVLLSEAAQTGNRPHFLKSLDPSVEDISVPYFPFVIGKQEGIADYVLRRDTVSRLHLCLDEENGEWRVTDLNSSNGTWVGEDSLEANESHVLSVGDRLKIADLSYIFY